MVSREVMNRVKACSIGTRTLSDHNPEYITISPPYNDPATRHWRLNSTLLGSPSFIGFLEKWWELFMATNNTPEVSPLPLWETAKAYIRGSIISYTAAHTQKTTAIRTYNKGPGE